MSAASKRRALVAMILASGVVFLDGTVVNVALPAIDRNLASGLAGLQWIVNGYTLSLAALLILGGSLADRIGRRRVLLCGLATFGAASVVCGLAQSTGWLIGARIAQGVAGALVVPVSLAIITVVYEDAEGRGKAIGTWSGWSGITTVVGPFVGGWLIDNLSWRGVFFINLPLIGAAIWLIARHVPESRDLEAPSRLDWPGAALAIVGLGGISYGLIAGPAASWGTPSVFVPLCAGVAGLVVFAAVEARSPAPMLPLALFRSRAFAGANLSTLGVYAALAAVFFSLTIYLQNVLGYTALGAGAASFPVSLLLLAFSSRFGGLAGRYGPRLFMALGPLVCAAGILLLLRAGPGMGYWSTVFPAVLAFGLGLATLVAPLTATVMGSVPSHQSGVASAVNNAASRVAGLIGVAAAGAVTSVAFSAALSSVISRAHLPAAAVAGLEAARRDPTGIHGAGLPADAVAMLDASATSAFHWTMVACAALAAAGGLVAALTIPNRARPPAARGGVRMGVARQTPGSPTPAGGTQERVGGEADGSST